MLNKSASSHTHNPLCFPLSLSLFLSLASLRRLAGVFIFGLLVYSAVQPLKQRPQLQLSFLTLSLPRVPTGHSPSPCSRETIALQVKEKRLNTEQFSRMGSCVDSLLLLLLLLLFLQPPSSPKLLSQMITVVPPPSVAHLGAVRRFLCTLVLHLILLASTAERRNRASPAAGLVSKIIYLCGDRGGSSSLDVQKHAPGSSRCNVGSDLWIPQCCTFFFALIRNDLTFLPQLRWTHGSILLVSAKKNRRFFPHN